MGTLAEHGDVELLQQWHPDNPLRPEEVSAGSKKKVRWRCELGHEWLAAISARTRHGTRCPVCMGKQVLAGFNDLASRHPELAEHWHPDNDRGPDQVTSGSGYKAKWRCASHADHAWTRQVALAVKNPNCPICSNRRVLAGFNDLATTHPKIASQWHTDNECGPHMVVAGCNDVYKWICGHGHEWESSVTRRTYQRGGCPTCSGFRTATGFNDLATTHPNLAKQWHPDNPTRPTEVTVGSNTPVKWICAEGHIWTATPNNRVKNDRELQCGVCCGRKVLAGFNDLATTHPHLISQWHPDNLIGPEEVTAGSGRKVKWVCTTHPDHIWEYPIFHTVKGHGCPYCSNDRVLPGFNDLATTHPDLVKQWHPDNDVSPTSVTSGSQYLAKWVCTKKHTWTTAVCYRGREGVRASGCPRCARARKVTHPQRQVADFVKKLLPCDEVILVPFYEKYHGMKLDIYIPSRNLAVEYNGLYWHTDWFKPKDYHRNKTQYCKGNHITLIHVWEDDWKYKTDIVKRMLAHKLGCSSKMGVRTVYARSTAVVHITETESSRFLESNHIQGRTSGAWYLGLRDKNGELHAVAVVNRMPGDRYLISRYATSSHVIGGFGKLLKEIESMAGYGTVYTFADLSLSDGALYEKSGFHAAAQLPPDYRYVFGGERVHKFNFRKDRFKNNPKLKFNPDLTERELANLNKIPRIWDCGKVRYEKEILT